jgi:DNA polymerase-3 subunit epsilon
MRQTSLDELGTPLTDVTFCVVDLETTGGSPATSEITEIGALKVRRGEVAGTFHSLVKPDQPVPAFIRLLTGISDELLLEAPEIGAVLPSFLEFARDTVLVAHNARFDVSFLNAALAQRGYERLTNKVLDTAALARKIIAGEVPNNRLATLAGYLRCAHQPCHRAFQDVLATTDVLHHLIERVAGYGVTTLEDLAAMSSTRMDGTFHKISLAEGLPDACGVYRFLGASGNTLYVGKATNIKARVRSYFYGDPRRKIRDLLRETQRVEVEVHETTLEAEVSEIRAIQRELPPYNRAGKRNAAWYAKISEKGSGKVSTTRTPKDDGSVYIGPFAAVKVARTLVDVLRDAAAIHRCSAPQSCKGCAFSELRTCVGQDRALHSAVVGELAGALVDDPEPVFGALEQRMHRLARAGRFEEAAEVRDRAGLLARSLARAAEARALVDAGDIVIGVGARALLIRNAQLAAATDLDVGDVHGTCTRLTNIATASAVGTFFSAAVLAEARVITSWLVRHAQEVRLISVEDSWVLRRPPATDRFAVRAEERSQKEDDTLTRRSRAAAAEPESIAS